MSTPRKNVYCVYAIKSLATGRVYIGQTADLEKRIREHNAGRVKSTMKDRPWSLLAWEGFPTRKEAMYLEWKIKRSKGLREKWLEVNKPKPPILAIGS
jgi:putative endonuclease